MANRSWYSRPSSIAGCQELDCPVANRRNFADRFRSESAAWRYRSLASATHPRGLPATRYLIDPQRFGLTVRQSSRVAAQQTPGLMNSQFWTPFGPPQQLSMHGECQPGFNGGKRLFLKGSE